MTVLDINAVQVEEPAFVVALNGDNRSIKGWVVVDSLVDGWAMGGVRMTSSVTEDEVRGLARGMTEKLTLVGLPVGGAKAGIVAGQDSRRTLETFGRTVAPLLHGGIHLGADLGVGPAERAVFFDAAGYDPRKRPRAAPMPYDWRTYYEPLVDCTGHGVGVAAVTALETLRRNEPGTVVIQGFGSVGRAAARFLERRGHRIVGVADEFGTISGYRLPVDDLIAITDPLGRIDRTKLPQNVKATAEPDAWLDVPADVLVLAAQKDAINGDNVHRLTAQLVVEGGNITTTPEAGVRMAAAGVTLVPDVVANVGGAAAAGLALTGTVPFELPGEARKQWVFDWVGTRVERNTRDLLEIAAGRAGDPLPELLAARREAGR
ncbi:glutamate dehydrogenase [Saccharothrix sp. NRRL B-16348]|jgi:glutamate dehydrogenase (NAD(P)+)|uniref:Glu/Leu/Phe/Val dehydrogenase dimerization domain-containing protein n=1 Tax=Saccharothrix sp. NRRL B-16348 TaxID=1415542 RepID=UPI0006AF84C0|nr:Glu/Leu/Phe/Val dehydrogenase dimerization domain-containing protein [Saccharothrix sp. NRRL B-16348]KOX21779.1 glutamate dehydrogenase [Saccharothrix sp. NRRL B-16348]